MHEALYGEMFAIEERHWWFTARQRVVLSLLQRYLPRYPAGERLRIADLGCGCGVMLHLLATKHDVVGVDAAEQAVAFCARRSVNARLGMLPDQLPVENGSFHAVMLLDVLEHLEHDAESARAAAELLVPGGILVCTVPAYPWLWSKRDEHHHHFRRYSKPQLGKLFDQKLLNLELLSHFNTLLFPVAATARLAARFLGTEGLSDLNVPPAPLNRMLRAIFASERALLGRIPLPFGLSLVAIARKR